MQSTGPSTKLHKDIAAITEGISGFLSSSDLEALASTAYHHGDVILEVGVYAGKSAVAQLLGARANPVRSTGPFYVGIDVDALAVFRAWENLRTNGLEANAALFLGDLKAYAEAGPMSPSMVLLDGDHRYDAVRSDLQWIEKIAAPGTAVLCHDYVLDSSQELEAKSAIDDFVKEGCATFESQMGAGCALIRMGETAQGRSPGMTSAGFTKLRERWLLDAVASLAKSWTNLNDESTRLRASRENAAEKHRAQMEKSASRIASLQKRLDEFKHIAAGLYRRKRQG